MTAPDSRLVPAREGRGEVRERGSRFLGFASRAADEEAARSAVDALVRRYHDATHVCFAWSIRGNVRAADSGEPPGTAGRPLLDAIRSRGLDETCLAVVRYFGGAKLGTGGLARCYREAGRLALEAAGSEEIFEAEEIRIEVPYEREPEIFRLVDPPHVSAVGREYGPRVKVRLLVRPSRLAEVRSRLAALRIEESPPD